MWWTAIEGVALFTFAMVMAAILESKMYQAYGALDSKMAAITMVKVNNAMTNWSP